jgi:pyridoxine 5-phosphate synthase
MIGEALFTGLGETVRAMRAAMDRGRKMAAGQPPDSENPTGKT